MSSFLLLCFHLQSSFGSKPSSSSRPSCFKLPLSDKHYHGSNSDHGTSYSAKVSDFDVGSVRSRLSPGLVSGEENFSAQVSDQLSSDTEVESEGSLSESCCYSDTESEQSGIRPSNGDSRVFLTQGKEDAHDAKSSECGLVQAARNGDVPLVKKLISKGCDLDTMESNRRTPLHTACSLGRLEIVRLLVENGANVDASSITGQTPLHEACINGRYAVLQEMISEVVDLDMVDVNGLSAAHYCAMNGEVKCLTLLCNQVSFLQ